MKQYKIVLYTCGLEVPVSIWTSSSAEIVTVISTLMGCSSSSSWDCSCSVFGIVFHSHDIGPPHVLLLLPLLKLLFMTLLSAAFFPLQLHNTCFFLNCFMVLLSIVSLCRLYNNVPPIAAEFFYPTQDLVCWWKLSCVTFFQRHPLMGT